ncbi:diguanylate cyclase [Sphingomonas sp. C3-2]|uniref:GGDEF domain-containing protein n=1 Tax=Sphingomonas sp. C3-2 TaxID=3062169 RepID=UPI00294B822E|nr:diguanylate cyclase [Sphingomonas sp. C3-2]WOK36366.1 diguanylate cyclase [Sphingomonas sp. C3-2]
MHLRIAPAILVAVLCALFLSSPARADGLSLKLNDPLCHAVSEKKQAQIPPQSAFRCTGEPRAYNQGTLWLRADVRTGTQPQSWKLLLRNSRFERVDVRFTYGNGAERYLHIKSGDFGARWRIGGIIGFEAPEGDAPLTGIAMGFTGLAAHDFLRIRLVTSEVAGNEASLTGMIVGGSMVLLLLCAIYNFCLAYAVRRGFILWHAAWAMAMLIWGALWSQLALALVPSLAGALSAQLGTLFSMLAIAFATMTAVTLLGHDTLPRWLRRTTIGFAMAIALAAIPATLVRSDLLASISVVIDLLALADVGAVALALAFAWRAGNAEARAFTLTWAIPMAALAFINIVDVGDGIFGGGAQLIVLIASSVQIGLLSLAFTWQMLGLREERDAARAAQAELNELAHRDALTGLLNRRGFVQQFNRQLRDAEFKGTPTALLVIDIDHFKSVNDRFGHEAGDLVLKAIGAQLLTLERNGCLVGRLGGEEFVLALPDTDSAKAAKFAETVRHQISRTTLPDALPAGERVTASIGCTENIRGMRFAGMFRNADSALYEAKNAGRNRVVVAERKRVAGASADAEIRRFGAMMD